MSKINLLNTLNLIIKQKKDFAKIQTILNSNSIRNSKIEDKIDVRLTHNQTKKHETANYKPSFVMQQQVLQNKGLVQKFCCTYITEKESITMTDAIPRRITTLTDSTIIAELKTFPNQATIWGILGEINKKQIWELPGGKSIMLMEDNCNDPFIFIAGALGSRDVDAIIKLCPSGFPMVYCNPIYHHFFLDKGWDFNLRVQLSYTAPNINQIYKGWDIKPINSMELFQQCFWFQKILAQYGSPEAFFASNKGYVLCQGKKVISEAYIDYYHGHGYAEIGVATNPDYRSQGAATQIASHVAEKCRTSKLTPIWSCQVHNRASLRTAIKVGFRVERYYVQMVPEVGNTFSPRLEEWIKNNPPESRNW